MSDFDFLVDTFRSFTGYPKWLDKRGSFHQFGTIIQHIEHGPQKQSTCNTIKNNNIRIKLYARSTNNSYLAVIGVHEMHGRMHPNYCQITILLVVDLC